MSICQFYAIGRLEAENERLEADHSHEIYLVQLETLEKTISQQQKELKRQNEQSCQQSQAFTQMKHSLETRLDRVRSLNRA
jgi:hypothetical protein